MSPRRPEFLIAIDPGAKGALASYYTSFEPPGEPAWGVEKLATSPQELAEQLKGHAIAADQLEVPRIAILEDVGGFTGIPQPGSRMFSFGRGFGQIEGVLACLKFQIIRVRPQKWQAALSVLSRKGEVKADHKRRMRRKALDLFPQLNPTLDQADALLILYWHLQEKIN
jgi:hypothetical protein